MVDVILCRRADFSVFDTYISEYDRSMSLLEESCRKNKAFGSIVKEFEVGWTHGSCDCHIYTYIFIYIVFNLMWCFWYIGQFICWLMIFKCFLFFNM